MAGAIETITDTSKFDEIFYKYFINKEVYLKTKTLNMRITFMGSSNKEIALKIPMVKTMPPNCIIFTRTENDTLYAQLLFLRQEQDDSVYIFQAQKIQIISAQRHEERKTAAGQGKLVLFVTKITSDFIIEKTMALEARKISQIKLAISSEIEKVFQYTKIYFRSEGMSDPRMHYFYEKKPAYVISDFAQKKGTPEEQYYFENIYSKDYYLINRKNFVSEIAVPINFKSLIPIGFIQVNNTSPLKESILDMVTRLAKTAEALMVKMNILSLLDDKLLVSDLSAKGIGLVFKDRTYLRYFQEKSYIYFTLMLPDNLVIPILVIVRNIALLENKVIKVGCEIVYIDENARKIYNNFIETDVH